MEEESVSPIAWMEVLETGHPDLDAEHLGLIEHCNTLTELVDSRGDWTEIVTAAGRLAEKCSEHFRSEEDLLHKTAFPRLERHKEQHREIERRFKDLVGVLSGMDGTKAEHRSAARKVRTTLVDILFRHDLDYKSHLQHVAGR